MKVRKKIKTSICLLLLLSVIASPSEKLQAKIYTGTSGDNVTYTLDTEKKVMTFEGEGSFSDTFSPGAQNEFWNLGGMHWVIGEGITEIQRIDSSTAYYSLKSIQLPASLKTIDDEAFASCRYLESIEIPHGVEKIGKSAFAKCAYLKEVVNNSSQTVYLPSYPDFLPLADQNAILFNQPLPYNYYVDGELAVTVPPGKTAIGMAKFFRVFLQYNGGTYKKRKIYYKCGETLELPDTTKKGYIFLGWTTKLNSNYGWHTISNEETYNVYNSTKNWRGIQELYAQYAKVTMKKMEKRKLRVRISQWLDADQLEIQYSTNKNFKNHKSIIVKQTQLMKIWEFGKKNEKQHYKLTYNRKKKRLSITLSKLKPNKKYYFRFQYTGTDSIGTDEPWFDCVGDWFKKSI